MATSTRPRTTTKSDTKTRRIPPYNVVLLNDDDHSMDFVMDVLCKVFGCTQQQAFEMMFEAHSKGQVIVWTGPQEVAELKAEQMTTMHEKKAGKDIGPLDVRVEPAAGI